MEKTPMTEKKAREILAGLREAEEERLEALEASGALDARERARDLNASERSDPYGQR